ncbi:MAG: hypothetical protein WAX04_00525 [Oscillospiraceae bacterium]
MLKQKLVILLVACFVLTSLVGCGQETPTSNSNILLPPVSSCETSSDKVKSLPVLEEYLPVVEDTKVKVTNSTGKINKKLQKQILAGEIVELTDGDCLDLNNDKVGEVIHFKLNRLNDTYWGTYILTVGNRQIVEEDINLTGKVYAAMLGGEWNGIQLLIDGDGPSADPYSHIFHYENDRLWDIGLVSNYANDIILTTDGFSGSKHGSVIHTWYRPADYILTTVFVKSEYEENYIPPQIVEVPRDIYPMGTIVTLKCDLPLQASRTNNTTNMIIKAGLNVVLVATDDIEWVYVSPAENSSYNGGWLQLKLDSFDTCLIGDKEIPAGDIFEGLFYAG